MPRPYIMFSWRFSFAWRNVINTPTPQISTTLPIAISNLHHHHHHHHLHPTLLHVVSPTTSLLSSRHASPTAQSRSRILQTISGSCQLGFTAIPQSQTWRHDAPAYIGQLAEEFDHYTSEHWHRLHGGAACACCRAPRMLQTKREALPPLLLAMVLRQPPAL